MSKYACRHLEAGKIEELVIVSDGKIDYEIVSDGKSDCEIVIRESALVKLIMVR